MDTSAHPLITILLHTVHVFKNLRIKPLAFRLGVETLFIMAVLSQATGLSQREASAFNPDLYRG